MLTIHANNQRFDELRDGRTVKHFAESIGVSQSSLSRVLAKRAEPGPRFIAKVLNTVPARFDELFEVVDDPTIKESTRG